MMGYFRLRAAVLWLGPATAVCAGGDGQPLFRTNVRSSATGRLIRTVQVPARVIPSRVVAPLTPGSQATAEPVTVASTLKETIDRIAAAHEVEPELVHSVIQVESAYNPAAISHKGAQGLMQLIPATARRFGVRDVYDPVQNVEGGVKYLKFLLTLFGGNVPWALAAYNAGEAAVAQYGGIPPYPETKAYVYNVGRRLGRARAEAERRRTEPRQVAEAATPEGPRGIQEIVEPDGRVRYVTRYVTR